MSEAIDWLRPSPVWNLEQAPLTGLFQPALLRFRGDDFMEEFLASLEGPEAALASRLDAALVAPDSSRPLKLFLPVHGHFYLVCCSLCCRLPGFPDRRVRLARGEQVFFVLRRLVGEREYAWVGPEESRRWEAVPGSGRELAPEEERLPMSRGNTQAGRILFFGYLPLSSSQSYRLPGKELKGDDGSPIDLRIEELGARFTGPLTGPLDPNGNPTGTAAIRRTRADLERTVSVYLLLEGWEALEELLPDVALALRDGADAPPLTGPRADEKQALLDHLSATPITGALSLAAALGQVARAQGTLNATGGVEGNSALTALGFGTAFNLVPAPSVIRHPLQDALLKLLDLVRASLDDEPPSIELPKLTPRDDERYLLRCVYARPECDETQFVVSRRSLAFQIAPYFDPDAPARAVRIPLPGDVSIAALRRFKKGVSFMMSNAMRRKMDSIAGKEKDLITKADPGLSEDGLDIAFICSFSIQIMFMVAFFLLLMFVIILNLVFWWAAFFKICLPIPRSLAPK